MEDLNVDNWKGPDGDPLSDENKDGLKKALAEGRMKWETVPGYKKNRACPKCGNDRIVTYYHNGLDPSCFRSTGGNEHFARVCATKYGCGYHWNEKVISAEEFAP